MTLALHAEKYVDYALEVHGDRYGYISITHRHDTHRFIPKYVNLEEYRFISCPDHGEFEVKLDDHLLGKGCPICNDNKNLSKIMEVLKLNDVSFETNFVIPVASWKYRYDLYLPDYNTVIEFIGFDSTPAYCKYNLNVSLNKVNETRKFKKVLTDEFGIKTYYINYTNLKQYSNALLWKFIRRYLHDTRFGGGV